MDKVRTAFKLATPSNFHYIFLAPSLANSFIPEDIFFSHQVTDTIELSGQLHFPEQIIRLEIHSDAFRASRNFTKQFKIYSCDLKMLNFSFLAGFNQLTEFSIKNSINIWIKNLPPLPNLKKLLIVQCIRLNGWTDLPNYSKNSLEYLNLQSNDLNDERAEAILGWIRRGQSNATLNHLDFSFNQLTRVPPSLSLFPRLTRIHLNNQQGPGFGYLNFSLSSSSPVVFLNLANCSITELHPDSFKGLIH